MLKLEHTQVDGWEAAIRGMRNPMNSWEKSDSPMACESLVGEADLNLMQRLVRGGPDHAKFLRMIIVTCDITAPLYWWKEFDTSADYCSIASFSFFFAKTFCSQSLPST